MTQSLYEILGIPRDAAQDEIKKAYKRLAMKHHPDKNVNNKSENEAIFKSISEAYTVLNDPQKRKHYDTHGTYDDNMAGGGGGFNMNDIFEELFAHGRPGGDFMFNMGASGPASGAFKMFFGGQPPMSHSGGGMPSSDVIEVPVSIQDIYRGSTKSITYDIIDKCDTCSGLGAKDASDVIACLTCKGMGVVTQALNPFMVTQITCPSCHGRGDIIKAGRDCTSCQAKKVKYYKRSIDIKIPKGVPNKFVHSVPGRGSYDMHSKRHADLVLVFLHKIDPKYSVDYETNDVKIGINIDFEELLCGFRIKTEVYDEQVELISRGYFNPQRTLHIQGRGLPFFKKTRNGDLLINFNVIYPEPDRLDKYHTVFLTMFKRPEVTAPTAPTAPTDNTIIIK